MRVLVDMVKGLAIALAGCETAGGEIALTRSPNLNTSVDAASNFLFTDAPIESSLRRDEVDLEIEEFIRLVGKPGSIKETLGFWRTHEGQLPKLANLARKYLGVPATQAAVERTSSTSGNIYSVRRRSMSSRLLENLTYLKKNEKYLTVKKH